MFVEIFNVVMLLMKYFRCSNCTSKKLQNSLGFPILERFMRKPLKCFQMTEQGEVEYLVDDLVR